MEVRIDKYLFAVRIFKTRSLATENCNNGRILINNQEAKPSKIVKVNDIITIKKHGFFKVIKVLSLTDKRVSASLVSNFYEDLTPPEEIEKMKINKLMQTEYRPRGSGRPTKKERRAIDKFKDSIY